VTTVVAFETSEMVTNNQISTILEELVRMLNLREKKFKNILVRVLLWFPGTVEVAVVVKAMIAETLTAPLPRMPTKASTMIFRRSK